jgi:transposase
MGAAVAIGRLDMTASALRAAASREKDGAAARRILALALVLDGADRKTAAETCGMDRQTLRDWVHRYNAEGLTGLHDLTPPGPKPKLTAEQQAELAGLVETGPDPARHGVVRWRRVDLRDELQRRFGVALHERSVGKVLAKLGYCRLSVRPRHPQTDEEAQEAFIRAHLAEFGIVAPVRRNGVEELLDVVADPSDKRVPEIARACLLALGAQLRKLKEQILEFDRMIRAWHRSSEMSMRLDEAPGIGPVLATALVATVTDPKAFRSGRNFSAWIGLVPKQHSSGGKDRLGSISKQGDRYLRSLFVAGALAVIRYAKIHGTKRRPWLTALLARRPTKVAAIALANKIARMVWAMMVRGERYKQPVALAA